MKKTRRQNRKKVGAGFRRFEGAGTVLKVFAGMIALCMVSTLFISGYCFFVRSNCLRIDDIQVRGVSILNREAIIQRTGIERGANILAVNLSVARRRLQAEPWIAEVRIARMMPSTIVIDIREHEPVAILDWQGGFLINSRRYVFKQVESTDPVSLPVISGIDGSDLDADGRSSSPVLNAALNMIETVSVLGRREPGMKINKVVADRDTGLTLYAFDAIEEVRLGFDDDKDSYLNKFRRLNYMLKHCAGRVESVRLAAAGFEYPDRVVVKTEAGGSYAVTQKGGNHEGTGYHRRS